MKAISLPVYDNSDISSRDAWLMNNLRQLVNYMATINVTDFDEIMELATIQYERQIMLDRMEFEQSLVNEWRNLEC
jgi:hypothetical protein